MKYLIFLFFLPLSFAEAATLYFSPQQQEVYEGEAFVSEIRVQTSQEVINAIDVEIVFPPELLEVTDLSMGGSMFGVVPIKPEYDNEEGSIIIQGGTPGGFSGDGLLATIFFEAKSQGSGLVIATEDASVFLHDGVGTPLKLNSLPADYTIAKRPENLPIIEVQGQTAQNTWIRSATIEVRWPVEDGVSYSYVMSGRRNEQPDDIPDEPIGRVVYEAQGDGIFYFHLRACQGNICGPTATRQILKDARPPEEFDILVAQDTTAFEGKRFLSFTTADLTSGVDHYEISFNRGRTWEIAESPYVLGDQFALEDILLKAVDRARNERMGTFAASKETPLYGAYGIFAIIGGMGILSAYFLLKKRKRKPS
jgi:hypothetical protein